MRVEWNKVIRYLAYTLELLVLFSSKRPRGFCRPFLGPGLCCCSRR